MTVATDDDHSVTRMDLRTHLPIESRMRRFTRVRVGYHALLTDPSQARRGPTTIYRGSPRLLADATLSPDGLLIMAGGGDGVLRFWDPTSGRLLWALQAHKSHLIGIHVEGGDIVTRGFAGELSRWTRCRTPST
jgi:WD40 repeat protein